AVGGEQPDLGLRMAGKETDELGAGIAAGSEDPDAQAVGRGHSADSPKYGVSTTLPYTLMSWPGLIRPSRLLRPRFWMPGSSPGMTSKFCLESRHLSDPSYTANAKGRPGGTPLRRDSRRRRFSAWRTGSCVAPCACRTSCARPPGCRG